MNKITQADRERQIVVKLPKDPAAGNVDENIEKN